MDGAESVAKEPEFIEVKIPTSTTDRKKELEVLLREEAHLAQLQVLLALQEEEIHLADLLAQLVLDEANCEFKKPYHVTSYLAPLKHPCMSSGIDYIADHARYFHTLTGTNTERNTHTHPRTHAHTHTDTHTHTHTHTHRHTDVRDSCLIKL